MPSSEPLRLFISYARKDGAALAQRLQKDLRERGFDAWLDTQRIRGGATWTTDIEHALDDTEFVLALMTCGSFISEICRAEQLRALRKRKCVIPLMAQPGADVPLHLEAKNYRDFTADSRYAQSFTELLADLHRRNGIVLKTEFRETSYVTVPPLPVAFVDRPEALAALRNALITDDGGRHIALTAVQGMGGIGKTVLAQALCHDEVVQQAFPDGIVWITIGKESAFDAITRMREVGKALGDDLSRYENELAAKNQYRSTIRKKAALIVVDDVWRSSDLEPLRAEDSPRSRLLFTTRDASIAAAMGAREHVADLLTNEQSREVFARWSRTEITCLPPIAAQLIHECGRLPLALSMVGAMLRGRPAAYWNVALEHLRNADLDKIKAQFPDYPYTDVLRAIQVSVDSLDETARPRYLALAVLLEDMAATPPVQQCLWGVGENQAAETAEQFVSLSLAQRDQPEGSIRLHDVQLDYVRAEYKEKQALEVIRGAVRLASNVITRSPEQIVSQMIARLLPYQDAAAIAEFTKQVAEGAQILWLRALQPTLHPPGTALIRTLEGHTGHVKAVALTAEGHWAVSASDDQTLRVWDLASGRELHTLRGHSNSVTAVAVTSDGRCAVSGSGDGTLKVWEVASGRELSNLTGHADPLMELVSKRLVSSFARPSGITAVAVTPEGDRAVSASWDGTLKVLDLESGHELHTLKGHTGPVSSVALTPNGRWAVSASDDKTLKVWDVASGRELRTILGHSAAVVSVAVNGDGRRAMSLSSDGTVKIWDLDSGGELYAFGGGFHWATALAVTPDFKRAVLSARTLEVWDLVSGQVQHTLPGHTGLVNAVALTREGHWAVSSDDQTLRVWDLDNKRSPPTHTAHFNSITAVVITSDGQTAVSASLDGSLKVWDVASRRELQALTGHLDQVRKLGKFAWQIGVAGVAVTPDGKRAVSAANDFTLKVWDLRSGRELRTLTGHTGQVKGVAVTQDGKRAVSASNDATLKVWDLRSGRTLRTLTGHGVSPNSLAGRGSNFEATGITAIAVTPDSRRAISACTDKTLKIWDLDSGRELRTLTGHTGTVWAVAVTTDGRYAVSASADNTLKIWDLDSGRELRTLTGHSNRVNAVAIQPDGRRAVSASSDNTVKLWNLETGQVLATFTCDSAAQCCAFSNALNLIVAGDAGGHLHFLRLEEPKPKC